MLRSASFTSTPNPDPLFTLFIRLMMAACGSPPPLLEPVDAGPLPLYIRQGLGGHVDEAGVVALECHGDRVGLTDAVLGDD